nr:hypothetical protein [Tanacetum cinerariifolium]
MANVIPPNDVYVIPEPVLVDENEKPEEEEFEEEEEPQEEEDMEVDIKEDKNKLELTFSYDEADSLNPPLPASDFEKEDLVEDIESLFVRVAYLSKRLCIRDTAHALVEKKGKAKDKHYGRLISDLGDEVRCIDKVEERMTALENCVKDFANDKETAKCKKLKKDLEEANLENTFLRMQNERVEIDLYCARVRAHDFYQEMVRRGFVFKERPSEAIDVLIKDEERTEKESQEESS